ncbi:segmentation protein cap'n'collar isoform X1 [Euwallacea similis]|uniref:segmentation protein cap'n'collar isoform X1 n=2 Tax=Euwallacea similis TaxID=1736056 RepID=UPI00344D349C
MLCIKKVYRDELLQLALIISLLRVNQDSVFDHDILNGFNDFDLSNGTTWRSSSPAILRSHYVNPKSLDSVLLNYERELFADLNSLGRYNRGNFRHPDVHAYLLNIERNAAGAPLNNGDSLAAPVENATTHDLPDVLTPPSSEVSDSLELTQEDMDLIEVLWKQDVDLGFSLELARQEEQQKEKLAADSLKHDSDASTSLLLEKDTEGLKGTRDEKIKQEEPEIEQPEEDIWAGVNYTIDTETGEYVIKGEPGAETNSSCDLEDLSLPLPEFLLDEALRLVDLDDDSQKNASGLLASLEALEESNKKAAEQYSEANASSNELGDEFDLFADMIQTPQFHHPHHRAAFQSRMPFVRTVSMEQRWQDLANLLSLPNPSEIHPFGAHHALPNYGHPHAHAHPASTYDTRGVLLHNASLPTPMGDLNSTMPYGNLGGTIGNAVATSMNLTNSSEPMGEPSAAPHYKLEPPSSDMMYYQNNTGSEFASNQSDGFLSNLLNDEDLQLMDMAMNEGMYTMRMLESNNTVSNLSMNSTTPVTTSVSRHDMERLDTSSDSAVSSMGSERVPSLSDGEWCDNGSDSGHTTNGEHYPQDYHNKYRPFDYSYSNLSENTRMPPVPQKKHLMYGKRFHTSGFSEYRDPATFPQENAASRAKMPEVKYSCSSEFTHLPRTPVDHIQHNHTYHLPAENSGAMQRPVSRDKGKSRKSDDEHLTRDEKRARALNIPISVDDIINLPMDEFNERLSKYDLSEAQLSLIRDIRRRGKNKVAAQNCRKRKLDQILSLADEVKEMRDRKMSVMNEHKYAVGELKRMKDKYQQLYRHVFQNLRDPDGNQYSPYQYSLQTAADGSILMVPRSTTAMNSTTERKDPPQNQKD